MRSSAASEAVYLRRILRAGDVEEHAGSVVVLGDVPEGCRVVSCGDVIVMGALKGQAQAGSAGDRGAIVVAVQKSASAEISIAGVQAPRQAGSGQMAVLGPGASAITFKPMPGSAALPAAEGPASIQLGQLGSLLVLALGLGLAVAPGFVLGTLVHSDAESMTAALLEVFVYGYILLQGANLLGDGSEMLLEILDPGIIGGVVLPVLGAVPDALIILNSGLHASAEDAQQEVAVGVGTLAGSTILLLSLAWGGSVLLGACDIDEKTGRAKDKTLTRGWDLGNTGVTVDEDVRRGAAIMIASVLFYGIVQVPAVLGSGPNSTAALVGAVTCLGSAVGYCVYSVVSPELQKRKIDAAHKMRFRQYAVQALALKATSNNKYGDLVDKSGALNLSTVDSLFHEFDIDQSGMIDAKELQGLLRGLGMTTHETGLGSVDESLQYVIQEFDLDKDELVTRDEFQKVLAKWVAENQREQATKGGQGVLALDAAAAATLLPLPSADAAAMAAIAGGLDTSDAEEMEEEMEGPPLSSRDIAVQASLKLAAGVALCALFSDPLVDALSNFSKVTSIPPFFVGFVLTPLASNASEFVSSLSFASKKRRKNMSLTMSQVYGAVTMNNTLVLGLFLLVVYWKHLEWVYSSEVTVIVGATAMIGFLGYSQTTFKTGLAIPAIAIYPASLVAVYLMDTFLGWQ